MASIEVRRSRRAGAAANGAREDGTCEATAFLARVRDLLGAGSRLPLGVDPSTFAHRAIRDEARSRIEMHLVGRQHQTIAIDGRHFVIDEGETIHTENSHELERGALDDLFVAGAGVSNGAGRATRRAAILSCCAVDRAPAEQILRVAARARHGMIEDEIGFLRRRARQETELA